MIHPDGPSPPFCVTRSASSSWCGGSTWPWRLSSATPSGEAPRDGPRRAHRGRAAGRERERQAASSPRRRARIARM